MGWYFLSEYQDFYRPGDPYGIVEWTHPEAYSEQLSGEFGIFEDALIRVSDLIDVVDLSPRGKISIKNELMSGLDDSEITPNFVTWETWPPTPTPKVALAARSITRHADTVTEFNAKLLDAIKRKEVDKAAYIRCVLSRSVVIEYSGVEDHERKSDKMEEDFLGATRAERRNAIEGWSADRLRACDELVEELCRCRRGFYVYNSIKANYQKAAGVIRRLINEGPLPPPHFSADEGIDGVFDERGLDEMGSDWDYDDYMLLTEDEEDMAAAEDSDTEGAPVGLARASRLRQMHSTQWHSEEENNVSGGGSSSVGDPGNASPNPRFDGNDSIGDDYDADGEDGEDGGSEDGGDGNEVGEDNI